MSRLAIGMLIGSSLLFGGCGASLQSRLDSRPELDGDRPEPLVGATYSLPMLTYEMKIARALAACPAPVTFKLASGEEYKAPDDGVWSGDFDVRVAVQAVAGSAPGERFRYDPGKLKAISKTTAFKMTYHPGGDRLAGINATLDDQSGAILGDFAKVGLAVASVALGPAMGGLSLLAPPAAATKAANDGNFNALSAKERKAKKAKEVALTAKALAETAKADRRLAAALDRAAEKDVEMIVCTDAARKLLGERKKKADAKSKAAEAATVQSRLVEKLLRVAQVRRLSTAKQKDLEDAAAAMAEQLTVAEQAQTSVDEIDASLAKAVTATWPKTPLARADSAGKQGPEMIADGVGPSKALFTPLLERRKVKLLNPKKFAAALIGDDALRLSIGTQASAFLDGDGNSRWTEKYAEDVATSQGQKCRTPYNHTLDNQRATVADCVSARVQALTAVLKADSGVQALTAVLKADSGVKTGQDSGVKDKAKANEKPKPDAGTVTQVPAWHGRIHKGLLYRLPVAGSFTLCLKSNATDTDCTPGKALLQQPALIPQLGALRVLPLKNGMFQNTGLTANFDALGQPTDVSFNTTKAIAANIAASAAGIAAQAQLFDETRRKQAKDARTEAAAAAAVDAAKALADAARAEAASKAIATADRTRAEELVKDLTADANLATVRLTLARAVDALQDYEANPPVAPPR